jgi:hypothetical protein
MAIGTIEDRVAALEAQMQMLIGRKTGERKKDWRKTIGMFAGDEIMREVCQNALAIREEDRRRSLAEFDAEQGRSE